MSNNERKALGRGFGALLKSVEEVPQRNTEDNIQHLDIKEISFNAKQPRNFIDETKLSELAQSIKIKGVIQPILVRAIENVSNKFELVAGERRLRASKLAGFDKVPAIVKVIQDKEMLELALIENIQRADLNPLEESLAYKNLLEEHGYTQDDMAKRVGKSRSAIANLIRLLRLPENIQNEIASYRISVGHARSLLSLENEQDQLDLKDKIINENISVRETENLVKSISKKPKVVVKKDKPLDFSEQMKLNQNRLAEHFSTKIDIKGTGKKGKIEINFNSIDDFNRIFSLIFKED